MMRAAYYERTGPAREVLQIGELPTPEPGLGELRVKLAWSGVNPSDVKSRAGLRSKELPFPRIVPHSDGAGIVDAVGEGVPEARTGERVWVWNAAWQRPWGTAAEYVVLPQRQAVRLSDTISLEAGACLGIPALTAYHAVTVGAGVKDKTVLVAGGAGAVGNYAVQIARRLGAGRVFATVSSAEKAAIARRAGADDVLNYKTEDVAHRLGDLTGGVGVDRIVEVDFAGNVDLDLSTVKPDGEIVIYGSDAPVIAVPFFPSIVKNVQMRFFIVYNLSEADRTAAVDGLTALLDENALTHLIAERMPLDDIARAHEIVEQRRIAGNVVLALEP